MAVTIHAKMAMSNWKRKPLSGQYGLKGLKSLIPIVFLLFSCSKNAQATFLEKTQLKIQLKISF